MRRASMGQSRWQNRLASGGDRSQPSAACSGGLAAATTATPSGSVEVADRPLEHHPQQRGLHRRRRGGDLVEEQQPAPGRGQPPRPRRRREVPRPAPRRSPPAARRSRTARGSRRSPSRTASPARRPARGRPTSCRCRARPTAAPARGRRRRSPAPRRRSVGRPSAQCDRFRVILRLMSDPVRAETALRLAGERLLLSGGDRWYSGEGSATSPPRSCCCATCPRRSRSRWSRTTGSPAPFGAAGGRRTSTPDAATSPGHSSRLDRRRRQPRPRSSPVTRRSTCRTGVRMSVASCSATARAR